MTVLARVNAAILKDASDEEALAEIGYPKNDIALRSLDTHMKHGHHWVL